MKTTTNSSNSKHLFYVLLVAGFSVAPQMSWGDGNDLLRACKEGIRMMEGEKLSSNALSGATFCSGYISGFSDGMASTAGFNAGKKINLKDATPEVALQDVRKYSIYCTYGNRVTNLQKTRVVVRYLEQNPQFLHEPQSILVTRALSEAFPCK